MCGGDIVFTISRAKFYLTRIEAVGYEKHFISQLKNPTNTLLRDAVVCGTVGMLLATKKRKRRRDVMKLGPQGAQE